MLGRGVSPRAALVLTPVCTHGRTGGIDAYDMEWIFDGFDARTARFEPALQTRAYAPDRLLSPHVMDV